MNKNIYIKISEFAEKKLDGFGAKQIIDDLEPLEMWEIEIIKEHIRNAYYNKSSVGAPGYGSKETMFYCIKTGGVLFAEDDRNRFILNQSSYFEYFDYLELQAATKNANEAHRQSILATWLAIIALAVTVVFSTMEIIISIIPWIKQILF